MIFLNLPPLWCKSCRNPFNPSTDYKEIYQLGISAAAIGKTHEAVTFLKVAKLKVPPTDTEYVEKIGKSWDTILVLK